MIDFECSPEVESCRLGERHRFGSGREIHRGEQVVDDLECRSVAAARPQHEQAAGNSREQRTHALDCCEIAGQHHRHRARNRLRGPARNRCIEQRDAPCSEARRERGGIGRIDCRCDEDDAAGCERRRRTVGAEQHRFDLCGIDHEHDHHVAGAREVGGRDRWRGTVAHREVLRGDRDVARDGTDARAHETLNDPSAHRAGADHADAVRSRGHCGCYLGALYGWQSVRRVALASRISCSSMPLPRNS